MERVTERNDGVTAERVTESGGNGPVVVERRGSGAGWLVALALLILAVIAGVYLLNESRNENVRTEAVSGAAESVERTADKVGDAVDKAVD